MSDAPSSAPAPALRTPTTLGPEGSPFVETSHELDCGDHRLPYTARAGFTVLDDAAGTPVAEIFTVGYFADPGPGGLSRRPLTFAYNGGPGASSLWVHFGALGPRRVAYGDGITQPNPPSAVEDNPHSWLTFTDLVFVDPPGTGFSRALGTKDGKDYWGCEEDAAVLAEFVRRYVTRAGRWSSPVFLAGESYGGVRSVALARALQGDLGFELAGLVLVSPAVDYATNKHGPGGHLASACALPSYTAVAHHHRCLVPRLQESLSDALAEAERFAIHEYLPALVRGTSLPKGERARIAACVAELTGLSQDFVENCHLAVSPWRFMKELLRSRGLTVGRFDCRLTGVDSDEAGETPEYDASDWVTTGPFVAAFNDWLRRGLRVELDRNYRHQDGDIIKNWVWEAPGRKSHGYVTYGPVLRRQLAENEKLHAAFVSGFYDVATPYLGCEVTVNGMGLTPTQRDRVEILRYPGGHMMYTDQVNHVRLTADMAAFYERAVAARRAPGS